MGEGGLGAGRLLSSGCLSRTVDRQRQRVKPFFYLSVRSRRHEHEQEHEQERRRSSVVEVIVGEVGPVTIGVTTSERKK